MSKKRRFRAGLFGFISIITAGAEVHAALEQDSSESAKPAESFDLPLLQNADVKSTLPMSPRLQQALQKALENQTSEQMKDGIFIIGPNGELEYLGKKSDLDKLREEIIRLKMEKNHAGKLGPTSA